MIDDELDATRPYRYSDYDGESLTLTQSNDKRGPFLIAEYEGQGGVFFGGTDDVLRTALAMIIRGADKQSPYVRTAVDNLRSAVEAIEDGRQYKRGQQVEVRDTYFNNWRRGTVMGYHDDDGYSIHPEGSGIYLSYKTEDIRELQEEGR